MKLEGFDELNKKLAEIAKNQAIQRNRFVAREAENLLSNTKNYTPVAEVDGGTLREGWKRTRAKEGIVHVYNNTDYALHVEYGHRQKNDGFQVDGKMDILFMTQMKKNLV